MMIGKLDEREAQLRNWITRFEFDIEFAIEEAEKAKLRTRKTELEGQLLEVLYWIGRTYE